MKFYRVAYSVKSIESLSDQVSFRTTYVVDNAGDVVTEAANAGTDLVQSSITYTLTANVENLALTGADRQGTLSAVGADDGAKHEAVRGVHG